MTRLISLIVTAASLACAADQHLLYVANPGTRNYTEYGGVGISVFDIDHGHKLVKRIATPASQEEKPDNIKGVCACAATPLDPAWIAVLRALITASSVPRSCPA